MKFKNYDYKLRKVKVEEILDTTDDIQEVKYFPRDEDFTYRNGYSAWTSAIFVDLRNSSELFMDEEDITTAKIIRGFTSEIIEILNKDVGSNLVEIGIRGDCVYGIYSTHYIKDIQDLADRSFYINTYMKMLNELLNRRGIKNIKAGIGLAASKTLAVKAGRKSSGINNLVWVGDSVTKAAKLADLGNKGYIAPIVMSSLFYTNYFTERTEKTASYFTKESDDKYGTYYHANLIKSEFNDWINDGMRD